MVTGKSCEAQQHLWNLFAEQIWNLFVYTVIGKTDGGEPNTSYLNVGLFNFCWQTSSLSNVTN